MSTNPLTSIRLDDEEWDAVRQRLTRINDLIGLIEEDFVHRIPAREFDDLRCYLGGIEEGRRTVSDLLHGGVVDPSRHPANGRIREMSDDANPHGITITDEVAQARTIDGRPTWYQHNIAADRLVAQLQRGLITRPEYDAAMAALNGQIEGGAAAITEPGVPG
jgi:hypothetical protein